MSDPFDNYSVVSFVEGIMLHCRRCGVHHWRLGDERDLSEIVQEALEHNVGCVPQ